MGLLKHKGQKKTPLVFTLHIHALDWPRPEDKCLVVVAQRGSHSAATQRAAPSPRRATASGSTYVFEEQLSMPVTLFSVRLHALPSRAVQPWCDLSRCLARPPGQPGPLMRRPHSSCCADAALPARPPLQDAAVARKGAFGPFLPKELRLAALRADAAGKPAGPFLGSVALNLADYASAEGRTVQQAFTLTPVGARLLVTIGWEHGSGCSGGNWGRARTRVWLSGIALSSGSLALQPRSGARGRRCH